MCQARTPKLIFLLLQVAYCMLFIFFFFKKYYATRNPTTTVVVKNYRIGCTEGLGLAVGGACLLLLLLGSSPHVHACHPRGVLHAHWVCRVFSGPWDQLWCAQAGPDTHIKKKKKKNYRIGFSGLKFIFQLSYQKHIINTTKPS